MSETSSPLRSTLAAIAGIFAGSVGIWVGIDWIAATVFGSTYSLPSHIARAIATCLLVVGMIALARGLTSPAGHPAFDLVPIGRRSTDVGMGALSYILVFLLAAAVIIASGAASYHFSQGHWH